ncbi:MAG: dehypoxanthine futalosine cyclase [Holophagales bacterium]|jgi:cyclic dehypoxanthinyl futalosine synthase|nr:dehypoxanthine futalosine cyclase [Holophagales bacterium]
MVIGLSLNTIFDKVAANDRIAENEAFFLFQNASLLELSKLATIVRNRNADSKRVSYVIDRNVNYTNICNIHCTFCAFHRSADAADSYVLKLGELEQKAIETKEIGGTGFLLQGGVNTDLSWDYYLNLVSFLNNNCGIWVHGFSPVEIQHMARINGLGLENTLKSLKDAGLGSLPGGGAEILVDRLRQKIAPRKGGAADWLEVMEAAHLAGLRTTGTMMYGITETIPERIEHLCILRNQQDRALSRKNGGCYTAFTAWPFQSGNTAWNAKINEPTDVEYLRTIAIARIFLDNFPHIQSSWVTMGRKTGQMALHYGCDDMGSLMIEENVVSSAGTTHKVNREEIERMISQAGFEPWQRNNLYNPIIDASKR